VFNECSSLTKINVATGNENYKSLDGILFNYDETTIIKYPAKKVGKEYNIPDGIIEIGYAAFSGCNELTKIVIPNSVTKISSHAFSQCNNLVNINLTDDIYSMGWGVFEKCSSLTNITIPKGITKIESFTFQESGLTNIIIPDNIENIESCAFRGCKELTNVTISSVFTNIDFLNSAFRECSSLKEININSKNIYYKSIDGVVFNNDCTELILYPMKKGGSKYSIPNGVTTIGRFSFEGCSELESISIPDSVNLINDYAFNGCSGLTSISIPSSVSRVEDYAFSGCSGLTNIIIPDSLTVIDWYVFSDCSNLKSISIPNSITKIDYHAFDGCGKLTSITIPDSVESISSEAFNNCNALTSINVSTGNINYKTIDGVLFNYDETKILKYPAGKTEIEYNIPENTIEISDNAFNMSSKLINIIIPISVTNIGSEAFMGCSSLKNIIMPNSVTNIGVRAFYDCSAISKVYYNGSANDWRNISISYDNDSLTNANIIYNSIGPEPLTNLISAEKSTNIDGTPIVKITLNKTYDDAQVIATQYNNEGALISFSAEKTTVNSDTYILDILNNNLSVKIMYFDNLQNINPISLPLEIE